MNKNQLEAFEKFKKTPLKVGAFFFMEMGTGKTKG